MSKILLFAVIVFSSFTLYSQQMPPLSPSPTPVNLETILTEAERQTIKYRENFSNLLAEEIKTFEEYDKNGEIKKTRRVESNFLVYQSAKTPERIVEYRNVTKVDGEAVGDLEKRAESFFKNVLASDSVEKELEKIQKESSRYDKNLDIKGLTLNQAPILTKHIRRALNFKITGEETIENRPVYVVDYEQKTKSPYIVFNDEKAGADKLYLAYFLDLPKQLRKTEPFLSGRLLIDKENFQILGEQRNVMVKPENQTKPVAVMEMNFEYNVSEFGAVTPKRITLTDYNVRSKNDEFSVARDNRVTFEYLKFTQSDVEVKSGEVDSTKIKQN